MSPNKYLKPWMIDTFGVITAAFIISSFLGLSITEAFGAELVVVTMTDGLKFLIRSLSHFK